MALPEKKTLTMNVHQLTDSLMMVVQPNAYTAGHRRFTFDNPCDYFTYGKAKASTLSLSVLVSIEMFNALNALSEVPPPSPPPFSPTCFTPCHED